MGNKKIYDKMEKKLVCLFSKDFFDRRSFEHISHASDSEIYKTAMDNLCKCDIYVLDEFAMDFNANLPCVSPESFYIAFISVDDSEVERWRK